MKKYNRTVILLGLFIFFLCMTTVGYSYADNIKASLNVGIAVTIFLLISYLLTGLVLALISSVIRTIGEILIPPFWKIVFYWGFL